MAFVYILYSPSLDGFYTGSTSIDPGTRLDRHLEGYYNGKYTSRANDWEIYLLIECSTMKQALSVEKHIKEMKSKKYIGNLKRHPEIIQRLKEKYPSEQ